MFKPDTELKPRWQGMPTSNLHCETEHCPHCGVDNIEHINADGPLETCHHCGKEYLFDVDEGGEPILRALRSPADMKYLEEKP